MKFIGITGGVGAGKTEILSYLKTKPDTLVLLADEIAHDLMEPGGTCYDGLRRIFSGRDVFGPDGFIDRKKMAAVMFGEERIREAVNGLVHPAVRDYVLQTVEEERECGRVKLLVLEAALLIEEHYDEICDELWYIYTREEIRRERLIASRGYTKEKVHQIFKSQLPEETYRKYCRVVIDNNGTVEESFRQIDRALLNMRNE